MFQSGTFIAFEDDPMTDMTAGAGVFRPGLEVILTAEQSSRPVPSDRFLEIDLIRGFMLLCMALDHGTSLTRAMGRHAMSPITIAQVLPSTTAEIFFFLSGYLYGHVRLAGDKGGGLSFARDAYLRAFNLYAFNVLTFTLVVVIIPLFGTDLLNASRFSDFFINPVSFITEFMLMRKAPFGLDVLHLYVIFFLAAPIFSAILLYNKTLAVAYLVACWAGMQVWSAAIGFEHDDTIAINIVAWQITFLGGIALGAFRTWKPIATFIIESRALKLVCSLIIAVMSIAWIGEKYPHRYGLSEAPWHLPLVDRASLAPLKLLTSICVLILMIAVANRFRLADRRTGRLFTMLGQRSLACFCASNIGIMLVAIVWQQTGSNGAFWLAEAGLASGIILWVAFVEWISPGKAKKKAQADRPATIDLPTRTAIRVASDQVGS